MASRAQIDAEQLKLLNKQLAYCQKKVPFYREALNERGVSLPLKSLAELQQLPVINKSLVRDHVDQFRSLDYLGDKVHKSFSSGSTGEPFASYFDTLTWFRKKYFIKLRARFRCGMRPGQRVAILECDDEDKIAKRNSKSRIMDPFLKVRVFSLFKQSDALLAELQEFAPHNIYAYPSHLLELASTMARSKQSVAGVKRLYTSSEFLESGMRRFIESQFNAEIFDHYGSTEFKEIAWECKEHGHYHVNHDEVICEVLRDGEPVFDTPGDVVITDLRNRALPLLRFELGDLATMTEEPCACGYQGLSMKPLGGRASDYLLMNDGTQLSPFRFTTEIEYLDGLLQYQLLQHSPEYVEVKTVWQSSASDEMLSEVHDIIHRAFQDGAGDSAAQAIRIEVQQCEAIANEDNGKFKVVKRLS